MRPCKVATKPQISLNTLKLSMGNGQQANSVANTVNELDPLSTFIGTKKDLDDIMNNTAHVSHDDPNLEIGAPSITGLKPSAPSSHRKNSASSPNIPNLRVAHLSHHAISEDCEDDEISNKNTQQNSGNNTKNKPSMRRAISPSSPISPVHQSPTSPNSSSPTPPNFNQFAYKNLSPEALAMSIIPPRNQCSSIATIFKYKKQLGKGATGRVLLVEHKEQHRLFALKEMRRSNKKNHTLFHSEVSILRNLKHENIVELYDVYMDAYNYYICLEYCSGGTMLERIISDTYFSEQMAANLIQTILRTLAFIHKNNVAHLDLKLNNIVFNKSKSELEKGELPKLKIIDFGLSELITDENNIYDEIHGSLHYFPPEIFGEGRTGDQLKRGDIWSIGVITYLILSGKLPFYGNSQREIINCIKKSQFKWPQNVELSEDCKSFIKELLNADCYKRIDAKSALKHKWIVRTATNDNLMTDKLMKKLTKLNFKNKLQRILLNSILSEMNEKEIGILISGMQDIDSNNDGFIDSQDIMSYIIKNQILSRVIKDVDHLSDDDNDEQYQHKARKRSLEIMENIQDGMEALENHHTLLDDMISDSNKEKDDDGLVDINHNNEDDQDNDMLAGLMDELEDEFNGYIDDDDYDIHDETEENKQQQQALEINSNASPNMNGLKGPFDATPPSTVSMISSNTNSNIIPSRLPSIPSPIAGFSNGSSHSNKLVHALYSIYPSRIICNNLLNHSLSV